MADQLINLNDFKLFTKTTTRNSKDATEARTDPMIVSTMKGIATHPAVPLYWGPFEFFFFEVNSNLSI